MTTKLNRFPSELLAILPVAACLALLAPAAALGARTQVRVDQGGDAFAAGEFLGTVLDADGEVRAGPDARRFPLEGAEAFTAVAVGPRRAVAVGTGDGGRVLRFDGRALTEVYASADEESARVTALAFAGETLWAGFAPSGALARLDGGGAMRPVEGVEAAYIWRIVADGADVLVATGAPAAILRVGPDGKIKKRTAIDAAHAMDVVADGGRLWVATAMPGRVLRVDGKGRARVVFEAGPDDEVRRIGPISAADVAEGSGGAAAGVWAVTNVGAPVAARSGANKADKKKGNGGKKGDAKGDPSSAFGPIPKPPKPSPPPKGAAAWWVGADGAVQLLGPLGDGAALDAAWLDGRGLVAAFAKDGEVRLLDRRGRLSLWLDAPESAVEALALSPTGAGHAVTSKGASLYALGPVAATARYHSAVLDMGLPGRVGNLSWVGRGVTMEARAGTTREPAEGAWGRWIKVAAGGGPPALKAARYVQYRATLKGEGAHLRAVRLTWRTPNVAPVVLDVAVVDRKEKKPSSPAGGSGAGETGPRKPDKVLNPARAKTYTGVKRIGWTVQDADGDALRFRVAVRQVDGGGHGPWLSLTGRDGTADLFVDWMVVDYPDGRYEIRVVADDGLRNPPGEGADGTLVHGPVLVDNTAPAIEALVAKAAIVSFDVADTGAPLRSVDVAFGSGPWHALSPVDGLLDGQRERFRVDLRDYGIGMSTLVRVRARDAFGHRVVAAVAAVP